MKINVNDCLKLDAFRGSRVLACKDECSRRVRSVSVLDEYDLDMGVERNGMKEQMVITHFWSSRDDISAQRKAVNDLGRKGISALVVYLNDRGVKSVAPEVVAAAEEVRLPLIVIDDNGSITYSMLIEQVLDKILYGENYTDNILNNTIYHLLNFEKHSSADFDDEETRDSILNYFVDKIYLYDDGRLVITGWYSDLHHELMFEDLCGDDDDYGYQIGGLGAFLFHRK